MGVAGQARGVAAQPGGVRRLRRSVRLRALRAGRRPRVTGPRDDAAQERFLRALLGVLAASALAYPLLLCAIQLGLAQLLRVDPVAVAVWLAAAVLCSVAVVAAVRWGAARRVRSPWLLVGLLPPVVYELWLLEPLLTG